MRWTELLSLSSLWSSRRDIYKRNLCYPSQKRAVWSQQELVKVTWNLVFRDQARFPRETLQLRLKRQIGFCLNSWGNTAEIQRLMDKQCTRLYLLKREMPYALSLQACDRHSARLKKWCPKKARHSSYVSTCCTYSEKCFPHCLQDVPVFRYNRTRVAAYL